VAEGVSVLVYGRNDGYGYNLARRAALSLNAIARVLADGDEILFCDCNTPDELPTFPEAIADTLTPRARALLRVVRLRPRAYRRLVPGAVLSVSEPLCRNLLLRRSRPEHRWILSTNSDQLFLPRGGGRDLGAAIAGLDDRLHVAPRLELPEAVWERLDRREPEAALALLERHAAHLRLDALVRAGEVAVFDGPGDAQLVPRALAFALDGFDESIRRGWHVDGNFCARARLACGANGSLEDRLWAFHCDHNRSQASKHVSSFRGESMRLLVHEVRRPGLPAQRDRWGAPDEPLEELRLDRAGADWLPAVLQALPPPPPGRPPAETPMTPETFNGGLQVEPAQVLPHVASHLETWPAGARVLWWGGDGRAAALLSAWAAAAARPISVEFRRYDEDEGAFRTMLGGLGAADVLLVDALPPEGAIPPGPASTRPWREPTPYGHGVRRLRQRLARIADALRRLGKAGPRPYAVASQHTWFARPLRHQFHATLAPFASRVRPLQVVAPGAPAWRRWVLRWRL